MYVYQVCIGSGLQLRYHAVHRMDCVKYSFLKEREWKIPTSSWLQIMPLLFLFLLPQLLNVCVYFTFVIFTDIHC